MSRHTIKSGYKLTWSVLREYYVPRRLLKVSPGDTVILQCSDHKVTLLAESDNRVFPCWSCDMFRNGFCCVRAGKRSNDFCRVGSTGVHYKNINNLIEGI